MDRFCEKKYFFFTRAWWKTECVKCLQTFSNPKTRHRTCCLKLTVIKNSISASRYGLGPGEIPIPNPSISWIQWIINVYCIVTAFVVIFIGFVLWDHTFDFIAFWSVIWVLVWSFTFADAEFENPHHVSLNYETTPWYFSPNARSTWALLL